MDSLQKVSSQRERAAALIIVLAFVVLVTVLVVAYFSRATSDRPVAHSSFNQSKADLLVASAMDNIIGDLRQEITNGSTATTLSNGTTIYTPTSAANMVPQRSGNAAGVPNLIRRSVHSDPLSGAPGLGSRASAVNSTTDVSANGRFVTSPRWNKHYLVPKKNTGTDDSIPIDAFTAATPDWVFVTNQGATIITSPSNSVIGRYAYAIYDEGGLLDLNVAGYPSGTTIYQYGRKGSLAFADLTALPSPIPTPSAVPSPIFNGPSPSPYQVDFIVGWRNYGTTQPTLHFPDSSPASKAFASNFQPPSTASAAYFYNFVANNTTGFLNVRSDPSPTPYPWNYLNVTGDSSPSTYPWNDRTDQMFLGRQQLMAFQATPNTDANNGTPIANTTQFGSNALQYLGTFSREAAAGAPQWIPSTVTATNPNFQTLLVTGSFTRNDGTTANVGDYLVNKRFLLERLNWLTYKGPSSTRTIPNKKPNSAADPDWDMWLLTSRFGLTSTFLQDPVLGGTAANILKYFGLAWDSTNERWNYVGHSGGSSPLSSIATLGTLTGTRDPDFFELLQAGIILPSSVDDDYYSPDSTLPVDHQRSKTLHILTIGANLIAQSRADSYPVRIACSVTVNGTPTIMEAVGATRLPYLSSLAVCPVAGTQTTGSPTGGINWFLVPNLWDPFRDSWDITEKNVSSTLTPNYLRPAVRISVSGSVGFGSVVASASVRSGVVPSASVSPFPSPSPALVISPTPPPLTLATATPNGRDGLLQASRLAPSDISSTVTAYTTTTSPASAGFAWNSIPYPSPTPAPPANTNFIAFRISFPGSFIPASATSPAQNPVLILKPGFQMTLDFQSPNGTWYSSSFLQGNNATNTWISASNAANPSLNVTTALSTFGRNPSPSPTPAVTPLPTILAGSPAAATLWNVATLAQAPMFAKADPRSIRYNSQIGTLALSSPPSAASVAAGVIGSIWPNPYSAPPSMTLGSTPTPTPTPTPPPTPTPTPTPIATPNPPNPATLGDNAPAGNVGNPYNEASSGDGWRPVMMNRPFRSVGEMGYTFRDQPFRTLSFSSANSPDAGLFDLFSVNDYSNPSSMRAGVINLNSRQAGALAAVLGSTITREYTPRAGSSPSPTPQSLTVAEANNTATILASNTTPLINRADLATLIANSSPSPSPTVLDPIVPKTQRESIARALGEANQTRTWNLLIDVIAQSGQYPPNTTSFTNGFVVQGEQRYWVHVAIDRFTGQVIDKQIEVVNE